MRFPLRALLAVAILAAVGTLLVWRHFHFSGPIPISVLREMEQHFKEVKPDMGETEVLETLGIAGYSNYLNQHCRFQMTGGGLNQKFYELGGDGYRLVFQDFMGNMPKCELYLPGRQEPETSEIGQLVMQMRGFEKFLNP